MNTVNINSERIRPRIFYDVPNLRISGFVFGVFGDFFLKWAERISHLHSDLLVSYRSLVKQHTTHVIDFYFLNCKLNNLIHLRISNIMLEMFLKLFLYKFSLKIESKVTYPYCKPKADARCCLYQLFFMYHDSVGLG